MVSSPPDLSPSSMVSPSPGMLSVYCDTVAASIHVRNVDVISNYFPCDYLTTQLKAWLNFSHAHFECMQSLIGTGFCTYHSFIILECFFQSTFWFLNL